MICCFDIGGSFIRYGASAGAAGEVVEVGRIATPRADFTAFASALEGAIADLGAGPEAAVSIALAGGIDRRSGIARVANIPAIDGRRPEAELSARLGRPVRVTNDADCFALAEALGGAGRGHGVVFGVILGSGVGGGLVIDGRLHAGHGGISGEWGHGPIVDPGAGGLTDRLPRVVCGCGHEGCLDPVGSARGLERIHALLSGESLQSEAIVGRWEEGDAAAAETVAVFVENIARALCVITNTIGASIVPVGGGLAGAPGLIAEIDRRVRALVMADYAEPLVVPGRHAKDGGLVGAALAAEAMEAAA